MKEKEKVYIETSVISYLTSFPSRASGIFSKYRSIKMKLILEAVSSRKFTP